MNRLAPRIAPASQLASLGGYREDRPLSGIRRGPNRAEGQSSRARADFPPSASTWDNTCSDLGRACSRRRRRSARELAVTKTDAKCRVNRTYEDHLAFLALNFGVQTVGLVYFGERPRTPESADIQPDA